MKNKNLIKIALLFFIITLIMSCAETMIIKYQVISGEGKFDVLYDFNKKVIGDKIFEEEAFSDGSVSIYVKPLEQNQTLDVRVFYETSHGIGLYKRVVSDRAILINDKIRVR